MTQYVFETFRTYHGNNVFQLEAHIKRLFRSAQIIGISLPETCTPEVIKKSLEELFKSHDLNKNWRIKLQASSTHWHISFNELVELNLALYNQGIKVFEDTNIRNFPAAKASSPLFDLYQKKMGKNFLEVLLFDAQDILLEGSITNIFAVFGNKVLTPKNNILYGTMRAWVIKELEVQGYKVSEVDIPKDQLKKADSIFCTNAIKGIVPVKEWGTWKSNNFLITKKLREGLPF